MTVSPDLLIVLGPRGLLSLVGIVLIVGGVWRVDRSWDEMGSAAYKRAVLNKSKAGKNPTTKTPLTGGSSAGVDIPLKDLQDAFPFPTAFLIGWALFGVSYFSPIDGSSDFQVTWYALVAALICLALGWIASVPMGDAVMTRNGPKKAKLGMSFVFSWLMLTIFSGYGDEQLSTMHAIFRGLGAVCIIASMKILWKFRKMGDTWEQQGKPNPNPVVYNMGGPLFVFGWFLFWVGMAATTDTTDTTITGIPIYLNARSAMAFLSGCGMVPVVMFLDYAHDEGAEFLGFGTDGRYFGRFLESPVPFILAWTFFGFSSWLPMTATTTTLEWVILFNCIAQGIVAGVLIQTALYKGDLATKNFWSVPFVLLFMALAVELGHKGGTRLALSLPGAILIIAGQKTVFGDRKRGDNWMETQVVNPNPIVYSYGEPLFMTGWILMSLVMSIPNE